MATYNSVKRCSAKHQWGSQRRAQEIADDMIRRGKANECLTPYLCAICGKWHIGHKWSRIPKPMTW